MNKATYKVCISLISVNETTLEVAASSMAEAEAKVREALAREADRQPHGIDERTDITIDGEEHSLRPHGEVEYFYDANNDRCDVWSEGEVVEEEVK